jgi:type II secretory pathway component PulF
MKTFTYKGVRNDGTVVEGEYQANVLQEVYRRMELHGMFPIKASEVVRPKMPAANEAPAAPAEIQISA